jgi:hypothetical protein
MKELSDVLLSAQRALLGVVTPELRAVVVDLDNENNVVYIRFYYHGEVAEKLIDLWDCAVTEVISDMDVQYVLDERIERLDYPNPIQLAADLVFERIAKREILSRCFNSAGIVSDFEVSKWMTWWVILLCFMALASNQTMSSGMQFNRSNRLCDPQNDCLVWVFKTGSLEQSQQDLHSGDCRK